VPLVYRSQVGVVKTAPDTRLPRWSFAAQDVFEVVAQARIRRHEVFSVGKDALSPQRLLVPFVPLTQFRVAPKPE
jgi:hypothetical protein